MKGNAKYRSEKEKRHDNARESHFRPEVLTSVLFIVPTNKITALFQTGQEKSIANGARTDKIAGDRNDILS
jgi:hypothetical protein